MIRFITIIKPRYVVAITIGVAALMFTSAFIELHQSREELLRVLQDQSLSLAEMISNSSSNIVLSTDRIEEQLSQRLLNNAHFIATMDSMGLLDQTMLGRIAAENDIYRINVFSKQGERILSSHTHEIHKGQPKEKNSPKIILEPILRGNVDQLIIGLKEARFEEGQRFAVAVKRKKSAGGAIVLNLDAATFVEFRKQIGIGKLINDLGNNNGIEYVAIQDREGILAATKGVQEMSTVENDPPLLTVFEHDTTVSREVTFRQRATFEVLKRLTVEGSTVGVLRIGLSMDEMRAIDDRMQRRILTMSIVLIFLGVIIVSFIVAAQNMKLISGKYESIQTLTGNILEHMNDAVVTIDRTNHITIVNRQAEILFGIQAKAVIGSSVDQLPENVQSCLLSVAAADQDRNERTLLCANNEERIVSISTSITRNSNDEIETRTMVIKDLTESRRLEKEIQRKEKMTAMGELAAGVAHEIRNPLNAISMIAQRYEKEFSPKKGVREYKELTGVLKSESIRINGIVQQFMKYARPKAIEQTQIEATVFIKNISTVFQPQANAKKIVFHSRSDHTMLNIDYDLMMQAVLNLLQNALDATPKQGSIFLGLRMEKNEIIIEVSDTGSGISPEEKEKIFDLYFTTKFSGTGMGLAITQQIVSQHNGSLSVRNNQPCGAIFSIVLPA